MTAAGDTDAAPSASGVAPESPSAGLSASHAFAATPTGVNAASASASAAASASASSHLQDAMDTFKQLLLAHSVIARSPAGAAGGGITISGPAIGLTRPGSQQQPSSARSLSSASAGNELVLSTATTNTGAAQSTPAAVNTLALPAATGGGAGSAPTSPMAAAAAGSNASSAPTAAATAATKPDSKSDATAAAASAVATKKKKDAAAKSDAKAGGGATKRDSARALAAAAAAEAEEAAAREAAAKELAAKEAAAVALALSKLPARVFLPQHIQMITDYAVNGVFSHYHLYQCVFNRKVFTQHTNLHPEPIRIDTILASVIQSPAFSLSGDGCVDVDRRARELKWTAEMNAKRREAEAAAAVAAAAAAATAAAAQKEAEETKRPLSSEQKKREAAIKSNDPVALAVEKHTKSLLDKLKDQERAYEERLKAIESKMHKKAAGATNASPAAAHKTPAF